MASFTELSIYYQNTRGLRTKTVDFYQSVCAAQYDCVSITESWLRADVLDAELFPPGYNVFRLDRDALISGKSDGGGVMLAISDKLSAELVPEWCNSNNIIEDIWVSVALKGGRKLLICTVYIPPHASLNNYIHFFSKLESIMDNKIKSNNVLLIGDFNLPNLFWSRKSNGNDLLPGNATDPCSKSFSDFYFLNSVKQFNHILNARNRILDLVITTSLKVEVIHCNSPFVPEDSHHMSLEINVNLSLEKNIICNSYEKLNFSKANYIILNEKICSFPWDNLLSSSDVDRNLECFYEKLSDVVDSHISKIKIRKRQYPLWFSRHTVSLIKSKTQAHKDWKANRTQRDYEVFSNLRKTVKVNINKDYKAYIAKTEKNIQQDTKYFWSFIHNKKKHQKFTTKNDLKYSACFKRL